MRFDLHYDDGPDGPRWPRRGRWLAILTGWAVLIALVVLANVVLAVALIERLTR